MEESGFEVITNYEVAGHVIDIYGTLQTDSGEVGVVVACKNYEEPWTIGIDVLKEMEVAARLVKASKIIIFTTSRYNHGAAVYAQRRNIKLVDRKGLLKIAKKFSEKRNIVTDEEVYEEEEEPMLYVTDDSTPLRLNRNTNRTTSNNKGILPNIIHRTDHQRTTDTYRLNPPTIPTRTLNTKSTSNRFKFNVDLDNTFEFFKNHDYLFLLLIIILCTVITYVLNMITVGPYTGVGKILSCVILCYGGVALINKDLSDIIFKGSVLFFISIFISIFTANM